MKWILLLTPSLAFSQTNYKTDYKQDINLKSIGGVPLSTGTGTVDSGTLRVVIATGTGQALGAVTVAGAVTVTPGSGTFAMSGTVTSTQALAISGVIYTTTTIPVMPTVSSFSAYNVPGQALAVISTSTQLVYQTNISTSLMTTGDGVIGYSSNSVPTHEIGVATNNITQVGSFSLQTLNGQPVLPTYDYQQNKLLEEILLYAKHQDYLLMLILDRLGGGRESNLEIK